MKLLIILLLFIMLILIISLYYNNYIDNFAVFDGVKPIARKRIAGTGTACAAGNCVDNATTALSSTFNFPSGNIAYTMASDSKGNIFIYDTNGKNIRKLIKYNDQTYGSATITLSVTSGIAIPTDGGYGITIDNQDNIYLYFGLSVYKASPPGTDNRSTAILITPTSNNLLLPYNNGKLSGITTDGTNIYCMCYATTPYVVKLSPPTSGTVWKQQRLFASFNPNGATYRSIVYAKDRNELAFTTHNGRTICIMRLNNPTAGTTPAGASGPDLTCSTISVSTNILDTLVVNFGITYRDNYYYIFEERNAKTLRRINMTPATPVVEDFFGPTKTPKPANYYFKSMDNPAINGLGLNQYAGCFDPSGALFIMDSSHTIVMISEIDIPVPSAMTNITDGTKIKLSPTDDTIAKAGITSGKLKLKDADLGEYAYDFDGTGTLTQSQTNPCIERNALFNVNNTGPNNRCVVMNEAGAAIPVPLGKKGAEVCGPNQTFWPPTCYNKTSPFMDYGEFSPTLDPMPTIEINKIEQFRRKKNMLMTAGQLNVPKNTDSY